MTWDEAAQLADYITQCPDGGMWHARVAVAPQGQGCAVVVREHGKHDLHYVWSAKEFTALCERLMTQGR